MSRFGKRNSNALAIIIQILAIMYAVQVANMLTDGSLRYYGIRPRDPGSLWFIVSAPFIHGSWGHLINNTFGFAIFSLLCLMRGTAFYFKSSAFIIIIGGLLVWAFARSAVHIGASGWVFGLWSLIIATAWFERSIINILISLGVIVLYGGMILGVLPLQTHISFESHLFGAIAGILAASLFSYKKNSQ